MGQNIIDNLTVRFTSPNFSKKKIMTEAAAAAAPKAAKKPKAPKPKAKPTHPPTAAMVMAAVKALKDAKGSSLPAIKKYIAANYKVDIVKVAPFIRKALVKLVTAKKLIQAKGKGASGSFKLNKAVKEEKKKPKKKAAIKPKRQNLPRRLPKNPPNQKQLRNLKPQRSPQPPSPKRQKHLRRPPRLRSKWQFPTKFKLIPLILYRNFEDISDFMFGQIMLNLSACLSPVFA